MEQMKLQILGSYLQSAQNNLSAYEAKLLTNDRSSTLKNVVDFYREETKLVSRYLMGLVTVKAVEVEAAPELPIMPIMPELPIAPPEPEPAVPPEEGSETDSQDDNDGDNDYDPLDLDGTGPSLV